MAALTMVVLFRSGAKLEVPVAEFSVGRNRLSGEIAELKWTPTPDSKIVPKYIRQEDIAAVWGEHS